MSESVPEQRHTVADDEAEVPDFTGEVVEDAPERLEAESSSESDEGVI